MYRLHFLSSDHYEIYNTWVLVQYFEIPFTFGASSSLLFCGRGIIHGVQSTQDIKFISAWTKKIGVRLRIVALTDSGHSLLQIRLLIDIDKHSNHVINKTRLEHPTGQRYGCGYRRKAIELCGFVVLASIQLNLWGTKHGFC